MVTKPALSFFVSDETYHGIGQVAVQWAYLETRIDFCLWLFLEQPQAAIIRPKNIPKAYRRRTKLWKDAANLVFTDQPEELEKINTVIEDAANLRGQRDDIIHGRWRLSRRGRRERELYQVLEVYSPPPNWQVRKKPIDPEKLENVAAKIAEITIRLEGFLFQNIRR